jgi:hypothetical protein
LQVQSVTISHHVYKNDLEAVIRLAQLEGPRAFYKGYLASLSMYGPYTAMKFLFFEYNKRGAAILSGNDAGKLPLTILGCSGALAGGISGIITCPMDVVRTRLMVQDSHYSIHRYSGILQALQQIVRLEGYSALFKGVQVRFTQSALGTALTLATCTCYVVL